MEYREYGKTSKKLSLIGFGGMRFTKDEEQGVKAMVRAFELGINYFDTAPTYCDSRSEFIFGKAFKLMKNKGRFYVSTKSSLRSDPTEKAVRYRIETSLKRMNVEKIDFFHMWCIMNIEEFKYIIASGGPLEGAIKAKDEGLIDHITFSSHASNKDIKYICNQGIFEGVTLGYNIINHSYRYEALQAAAQNQMGVVVMNPLGGGALARADQYFSFMKTKGESMVVAALRWVALHPEVTVVLTGMADPRQVEENIKAGEKGTKPDFKLVKIISEKYKDLGEHFCTGCRYCLPCSEGIHIPEYMIGFDYVRLGQKKLGLEFIELNRAWTKKWVKAKECTECHQCEERCTQKLPISQYMKKASQIFG